MSIVNTQKKRGPDITSQPLLSRSVYPFQGTMYERDSVLFVRVKQQENIP
nr:MAG TPA: hypothetical protein [Caudoviricetes sp.]